MFGLDLNLAASSSASSGVTGPFNFSGGSGKAQMTMWIVVGIVAVFALLILFKKGK